MPNEWLKRPGRVRGFVLAIAALIVLDLVLAVSLARSPKHDEGAAALGGAIFFLVFALPLVWAVWRVSRAGLMIGTGEIVIRGPLRKWRIEPSAAIRFVPGVQRGAGNGTPCPVLERSDGSPVGVWALGREGVVWRFDDYLDELQPLCDELNRLLGPR